MSMGDRYSDEKLQLFIDNEMNSSDRAEIMDAISSDEDLSNRVCELIQLKDAVRLAYSEPPEAGHDTSRRGAALHTRTWLNAVAAVLLLAIGTLGGWMLYSQFPHLAICSSFADSIVFWGASIFLTMTSS